MRQVPYQFRFYEEAIQKDEHQYWLDKKGNGGPEEAFASFNAPPKQLEKNLYWLDERYKPQANCTAEDLLNGNLFQNYHFISKIGIQTTPGVKFSLNGSPTKIEIGSTGIYELDLTGKGTIDKIQFYNEENSGWGKTLPTKNYFYVFVDIVYKDTSRGDVIKE